MATQPSLRIGDAERDAVAAELREHYAHGRLTLEEFNQRLDAVFAAKTQRDLSRLTSDLPHVRSGGGPLPSQRTRPGPLLTSRSPASGALAANWPGGRWPTQNWAAQNWAAQNWRRELERSGLDRRQPVRPPVAARHRRVHHPGGRDRYLAPGLRRHPGRRALPVARPPRSARRHLHGAPRPAPAHAPRHERPTLIARRRNQPAVGTRSGTTR